MKEPQQPNVLTKGTEKIEDKLEGTYWTEVIRELRAFMGDDFLNHRIVFVPLPSGVEPDVKEYEDPHTILIVLSDNSQCHYTEHFKNFLAVFKVHLTREEGNVFPVPLGYTRMQLRGSDLPADQRPYNVFYSGNINSFRTNLWTTLNFKYPSFIAQIEPRIIRRVITLAIRKIPLRHIFDHVFPQSYIRFSNGFAQGLGSEDYTSQMETSKLCLVPHGFWRAETFRHFEAMRAGTVVISDRVADTWYFKNSPIIQLTSWSDLRKTVNALLADPVYLKQVQRATLDWWENVCSPKSVARYMFEKIQAQKSRLLSKNPGQAVAEISQ